MRCLAVKQPWAWALVAGAKDIENRTWSTDYRGPIAILASTSKTLVNQFSKPKGLSTDFPFGAIIGVVDVLDVAPMSESLEKNPWASGPYCWLVGNARKFAKPIPAKGKLNLFTLDADLAEKSRIALETATAIKLSDAESTWVDTLTHLDDEKTRYIELFSNYLALADGKSALRLAETGIARWGDADSFADRANAKLCLEDLSGALDDVNQALKLDLNLARGYQIRSFIYDDLAAKDDAKAVELNPTLAPKESKTQGDLEADK